MSAEEESDIPDDFFKDVTFYIVGDIAEDVIGKLKKGGGKRDTYLCEMVTHVIADDVTNHEYQEARELFELPCVMSDWVHMSVKCKKLLDKELFAPEGRVFSGVVACASQVEEQDWLSLWGMIVYHGGRCHGNLTPECTHLITAALEGPKYDAALEHADTVKIVTPDWVTECIEKNKIQDEKIYHPRLIVYPKPESPPKPETPPKQESMELSTSPANQEIAKIQSSTAGEKRPSEEGSRGSRPNTPSAAAKEALARMVNHRMQDFPPQQRPHPVAPGAQQKLRNITNNIDIHRPQGRQSQKAQKAAPMINHPQHPPPTRHPPPSYYMPPIPMGLPFPHHQQQQQQQTWPTYWGHDPTDNVPPDMCLLGCIFYITDYPKIVGLEQIAVWKQVIEQHGGQVDPSYSNRVTHVLCSNQKSDVFLLALRDQRRVVTAFWLNDVLLKKKMLPPWQALHLPLLYSEENNKPCSNQILCVTNFEDEERTRVKQMINAIGAKYTGYMTRTNSALVCKGPDGVKYQKAKEWRIPVVNVLWLSDLILGHMDALKLPIHNRYLQVGQGDEFQMDINKVHHLMLAWQTPLKVSKEWKKFMPSIKNKPQQMPGQENVQSNKVSCSDHSNAKKPRLEIYDENVDLSSPGPRVLFTGFPKGVAKRLQPMVQQLGGTVVENPKFCTHLVAQSFSRTMKFFVAINVCHHIVTKQWVEDSFQSNQFRSETNYALQDLAAEAEMKCSLQQSVSRARSQPLFAGLTFYVTPSVQPSVSGLQRIIESAGGTLSGKRRLSAKTISSLVDDQVTGFDISCTLSQLETVCMKCQILLAGKTKKVSSNILSADIIQRVVKGNPTYIVITCANDIHLCEDLITKKIKVYTAEFILTGVMRQEKNFNQFQIEVQ